MVQITIDTDKSSKEDIQSTIEFLQKFLLRENFTKITEEIQITTTSSEPSLFENSMPSTEPIKKGTSANEILNMFGSDDGEEIKPKKGLTDFSQFMQY
jgi:hypothetical protein